MKRKGIAYLAMFLYLMIGISLNSCKNDNANSENKGDLTNTLSNYELVWADEFDYTGLPDSTKWAYDTEGNEVGWGNNEDQIYTEARLDNAFVEDGILHIKAINENFQGKEFTSARLITKAGWLHGRFEIKARVPKGNGSWSAIWMMPEGWHFNDGGWPDVGEIDIMEHVGHEPGVIHASAHSKDHQWWEGTQVTDTTFVSNATTEFHTYALEWDEKEMRVYADDKLNFTYKNEGLGLDKWPFVKPFSIIMNVAVGGEWGKVKGIDKGAFPHVLEVEYVRVYKKK